MVLSVGVAVRKVTVNVLREPALTGPRLYHSRVPAGLVTSGRMDAVT
jgi:hypothetical protein